jgi:hypothetical protein
VAAIHDAFDQWVRVPSTIHVDGTSVTAIDTTTARAIITYLTQRPPLAPVVLDAASVAFKQRLSDCGFGHG